MIITIADVVTERLDDEAAGDIMFVPRFGLATSIDFPVVDESDNGYALTYCTEPRLVSYGQTTRIERGFKLSEG